MSLHSRARSLQALTKWKYQYCLQEIQKNDLWAKEMAAKESWSINRADAFVIDELLDPEYRAVYSVSGVAHVNRYHCEECSQLYFQGVDRKGEPLIGHEQFCPRCIDENGTWECCEGHDVLGASNGEIICDPCFQEKIDSDRT